MILLIAIGPIYRNSVFMCGRRRGVRFIACTGTMSCGRPWSRWHRSLWSNTFTRMFLLRRPTMDPSIMNLLGATEKMVSI